MINFDTTLETLINSDQSDFFIFVATINDSTADNFIKTLRKKADKQPVCSLILTTYGGDPDAGYRIIRAIKRYYSTFRLYILGSCKSTGTLMALGADEIIMSDFGEFGPLDIQLAKDDELSNTSGLNIVQSLSFLNEQLFRSFEFNFLSIKRLSRNTITTRTAAEISSKLAVGLISPISGQVDPVKLGEVNRAIQIANDYGTRLCDNNELIGNLIVGYPTHGFVIDYEEAKDIFPNVRWVNDNESILEQFLHKLVRAEGEKALISELKPSPQNNPTAGDVNGISPASTTMPPKEDNTASQIKGSNEKETGNIKVKQRSSKKINPRNNGAIKIKNNKDASEELRALIKEQNIEN